MSTADLYFGAEESSVRHAARPSARYPAWVLLLIVDGVAALLGSLVLLLAFERAQFAPVAVLTWPLLCAFAGAYSGATATVMMVSAAGRRLLVAALSALAVIGFFSALGQDRVSRELIFIALPVVVSVSVLGRLAARAVSLRIRGFRSVRRVLIVAEESAVRAIARRLQGSTLASTVVAGVVPELAGDNTTLNDQAPLLVGLDRIVAAVDLVKADTVFIANAALTPKQVRELAWTLEGRDVEIAVLPSLSDVASHRVTMQISHGMPMVWLHAPRHAGMVIALKHGLDRVLASGMLALAVPLFLGLAIVVRLTSKGPALFRQIRVGKQGTTFTMLKFRTMVVDAETQKAALMAHNEAEGPLFKLREDPRVTRVGRFLRKYSLDELPQLINVVRGEMSLVGPRPPLPEEVAAYDEVVRRRMLVRPGLTGLWQVSGRSDLAWEETVRMDLRYVDNVSLSQDADILRRTVSTVFRGDGAY